MWERLVEVVREWASRNGLQVEAVIVYGSAARAWPGPRPPDIDVAVFLRYDRWLAKSSWAIRRLETGLKAEWDAWAEELGEPALDPLVIVGYKPILPAGGFPRSP